MRYARQAFTILQKVPSRSDAVSGSCVSVQGRGGSTPNREPAKQQNLPSVQLYDLSVDVAEKTNLEAAHPEVVEELTSLMQQYVDQGRNTPGEQQPNDRKVVFGH